VQRPLTIRTVLAGFFLLLFAFCITPKRTLHSLLANHKDGRDASSKANADGHNQIGKAYFYCQCDNFVAESPFTGNDQTSDFFIPSFLSGHPEQSFYCFISSDRICFGLRGPPVV